MPTYPAALRTARLNLVKTALDAGSGPAVLVLLTAGNVVLVSIPLPDPASSVAGDVLTILGVPDTANASAGGVAAKAELRDSTGALVAGLTLGIAGSGAEVTVLTTTIVSGQPVPLTVGTITHPTT